MLQFSANAFNHKLDKKKSLFKLYKSILNIYCIVLQTAFREYQMKNYKIKTGINFMIFILIFVENCL